MASAITGIDRSITAILESAGPKTFFVQRYFSGGLDVSDGSDEMSPWRRMPWITIDEAELIRRLPAIRDINIGEYATGRLSFGTSTSRAWPSRDSARPGTRSTAGTSWPAAISRRSSMPRAPTSRSSTTSSRRHSSRAGRRSERRSRFSACRYRPRDARRGRVHVQQRGRATPGDPSYGLYQGGRLRQGLDGNRGGPHRAGHDARGPGSGDRGAPEPARAPARRTQQLRDRDTGSDSRCLQQDHRRHSSSR